VFVLLLLTRNSILIHSAEIIFVVHVVSSGSVVLSTLGSSSFCIPLSSSLNADKKNLLISDYRISSYALIFDADNGYKYHINVIKFKVTNTKVLEFYSAAYIKNRLQICQVCSRILSNN